MNEKAEEAKDEEKEMCSEREREMSRVPMLMFTLFARCFPSIFSTGNGQKWVAVADCCRHNYLGVKIVKRNFWNGGNPEFPLKLAGEEKSCKREN